MSIQNSVRYKYYFEYISESGKVYTRTRHADHILSPQEKKSYDDYYTELLSLRYKTEIISSCISLLGTVPNPYLHTNNKNVNK